MGKQHESENHPGGPDNTSVEELASWGLWRQLQMMRLAAASSASVDLAEDEIKKEWEDFCRRHGVDPTACSPVPPAFSGCQPAALKNAVERDLRIARWKKTTFGPHAREHFEVRKHALDRVVYSLLRVRDAGLARELWFRLSEGEADFSDLAPRYSGGHEEHTAGIVGPSAFSAMHPSLAAHLRAGEEGKLLKPLGIGDIFVVARVEKFLPAQFDDAMEARMVEELASQWLKARLDESAATAR